MYVRLYMLQGETSWLTAETHLWLVERVSIDGSTLPRPRQLKWTNLNTNYKLMVHRLLLYLGMTDCFVFLLSSPVVAVLAWDVSAVMERRSKIVTDGNESISGLCLTHRYMSTVGGLCCTWATWTAIPDGIHTPQQAHTLSQTHMCSPIQILALIKKTKERQCDEGKSKNAEVWLKVRGTGFWGTAGVVSGWRRWNRAISFLPQCGFRLEVDY